MAMTSNEIRICTPVERELVLANLLFGPRDGPGRAGDQTVRSVFGLGHKYS
jgi:hypothetical protein